MWVSGLRRRLVAGVATEERRGSDGGGDEQREGLVPRAPGAGVNGLCCRLRLPLENPLAEQPCHPAEGGVSTVEDGHASTVPAPGGLTKKEARPCGRGGPKTGGKNPETSGGGAFPGV